MPNIHYFGIRHHGPGSSQRLVAALEELQPACVLIEGPADCTTLLPLLASREMRPPVALLSYAKEDAGSTVFYPFADFSPEYQATLYAVQNDIDMAFIDVPVNIQLARHISSHTDSNEQSHENSNEASEDETDDTAKPTETPSVNLDPIAELAHLAGYDDAEGWWNDFIEQNHTDNQAIFDAVEQAMSALREDLDHQHPSLQRDLVREAFMRLEIAKANKKVDGPIAVVCGAWHVPALKAKHTAKSDRELIKQLPTKLSNSKVASTWIPWTSARLAVSSGYGAGIDAPMWYQHLWQHKNNDNRLEHWLTSVTHVLRDNGQTVSTASVIEAVRLSHSLAAIRGRPSAGFEEIREAVVTCLCFGESNQWRQIESQILLGNEVGEIPADTPLMPLMEDLQRHQKKFRLKAEALPRELSLDLRSDAGLGKSILLHRLNLLGIPWGQISDSGKSRGSFRENWQLQWDPEFAVKLVENLVYGSTIEQASTTKIIESMRAENNLSELASTISFCLEAQLNKATDVGLDLLEVRAAHTDDCLELLKSIAPLIDISRYGTAREMSLGQIDGLIERLALQTALSMPYACRNVDDDEASQYHTYINKAHQSINLLDDNHSVQGKWWQALQTIVESQQSNLQVAGLATRLMYQADKIASEELEVLLGKALSPAVKPADAARYFDGFFSNAVDRLLYDDVLLTAIEHWLLGLDEESFVEFLPLFRRIFADLDAMERKRLIDRVRDNRAQSAVDYTINDSALLGWPEHLAKVSSLLRRDKNWHQ